MLNEWQALAYLCGSGAVELDRDIVENVLRCVCLIRKNFLFMGADGGGERPLSMYSLINLVQFF